MKVVSHRSPGRRVVHGVVPFVARSAGEKDGEGVFGDRITDAFQDRGFVELVREQTPVAFCTFGSPARS